MGPLYGEHHLRFPDQRVPQLSHRCDLDNCKGVLEFGGGGSDPVYTE